MKLLASLILGMSLIAHSISAAEILPRNTADHLQNVSVTIRSEGAFSAGEGSGVIFTRKDSRGEFSKFRMDRRPRCR